MTQRHSLIAFSLLLFAICYLATVAAVLAYMGKYAEALGFGGITTGLVGVIGTFRPKADTPTGTPADPVSVKETEPQP